MAEKLFQCMEVWGGNQKTDTSIVLPGLDAWIYCEPWQEEEAGGDVHYLSSCASGRVVRMLVADVSGHGNAVADMAKHLRSLMRRYVNNHYQSGFVKSLNREFTAASTNGIFATAVAMTFDSPTNRLLMCNAGHPPPLWYQAESGQWTFLEPQNVGTRNMPWGIEESVDYEQFAVSLKVGDIVLSYTDSLIEARDSCGNMVGSEGLLKLVQSLGVPVGETIAHQLMAAIDSCGEQAVKRDDVTCLVFRPNGTRPRVPFIDNLMAPFRVLAGWAGVHFGWIGRNKAADAAVSR
jgi:sigma-B regulation protein RsbU (phosphoserine phosphatase)